MPNWCQDTLSVSGDPESIRRFKNKARGPTQSYNDCREGEWPLYDDIRLKALLATPPDLGEEVALSFHALYPVPDDFLRFPYDDRQAVMLGEKVGEDRPYGGYEWERIHWGVKWGSCEASLEAEEDSFLQYEFTTPWGPPMEFLQKISELWPDLVFELEYSESGMGFAGKVGFRSGDCFMEETWDMDDEEGEE
jgi:hypothetical protein|tara:strand:+ start:396 stop:974 length:579 start_codon:yes stop_codon:yes gene_type:complete